MKTCPLRTSVIGSYPFPGWLEFGATHLNSFGPTDVNEMQDDAVVCAIHDQLGAGLDVITDGEQTRLDFNLSFYGHIKGIDLERAPPRRFGPPAHDQRGKHAIIGELISPQGPGVVDEFKRLVRLAPAGSCRTTATRTAGTSPKRCCRSCRRSSSTSWRQGEGRSASMSRR
jgi:5-methyltetrahydropteroyltriglutamate--homocysteine methyltransferase